MWTKTVTDVDLSLTVLPKTTIAFEPVPLSVVATETYIDGKRWYVYNGVKYPSITTLLSATDTEGRDAITKWQDGIGHAAAHAITRNAANRGTQWHGFCEKFVQAAPIGWQYFTQPEDMVYAANLGQLLNTKIRRVLSSEARVVSPTIGAAGRMDLCVELWDGRIAILDFKTGKRPKSGNRLANYGIQSTFYAKAFAECAGVPVDWIVILQLLPGSFLWQESKPMHFELALTQRVAAHTVLTTSTIPTLE